MSAEKDIVTDILQRVTEVVRAELGAKLMEQATLDQIIAHIGALEKPVRQVWGRSETYIAARSGAHEQTLADAKAAALAEVRRTGNVAQATRHGVSRATLYRLLGKK